MHNARPNTSPARRFVNRTCEQFDRVNFEDALLPSTEATRERTRRDLVRTKPLIAAIARELWKIHGGNEVLNWLEAEILLENALSENQDRPDEYRGDQ